MKPHPSIGDSAIKMKMPKCHPEPDEGWIDFIGLKRCFVKFNMTIKAL